MIATIAKREFKTLFLSPIAWSILAVLQFILAYLFLKQVETFMVLQPKLAEIPNSPGLTDIVVPPLFGNTAIILLLVTPLLTMRLIAEERRNKTLPLLLSAPVSNLEIILGKFFGCLGLLAVIVGLVTLMPLSLLLGGDLDFGKLSANIMALLLLVAALTAAGLYLSCLSQHPIVAAIGSFGLLLMLWLLDTSTQMRDQRSEFLEYLSLLRHFQNLQSGLLNSVDVLYFLLFISGFLLLSIRRLDKLRFQK
jgi:ABC-2 type transport system permease protein